MASRVISGTRGGRELICPAGRDTRPTSAKVREAIFAILGDIAEYSVLDLYAGSGALGIEALSRGARAATFVEAAARAYACIRQNLAALGFSEQAVVLRSRAETAAAKLAPRAPFDVVLCDPPWAIADQALALLERYASAGLYSPRATLLLEHSSKTALTLAPDSPLELTSCRRWGDTACSLFVERRTPA